MTVNTPEKSPVVPRVPLGERGGQRIATYVLLGVSLLGVLTALFLPPAPLYRALGGVQAFSSFYRVVPSKSVISVVAAYSQVILFVASAVISFWWLRGRWRRFCFGSHLR
jgi:hypothetical protein